MWGGQPEIMERNIRGNFVFKTVWERSQAAAPAFC